MLGMVRSLRSKRNLRSVSKTMVNIYALDDEQFVNDMLSRVRVYTSQDGQGLAGDVTCETNLG